MTVLSQTDLLDAMRAVVDAAYLEPLETEDSGAGFDIYRAIAAIFERASQAVERSTQAMYITAHSAQTDPPAVGGARAAGVLAVTREAPTDGAVVLLVGDVLVMTVTGPDADTVIDAKLEVTTATTFAAGVSGPVLVPVRALRVGYHANLGASTSRTVVFHVRTAKTLTAASTTAPNLITDSGLGDGFDDGDVGGFVRFTAGPNLGLGPRRIEAVDTATATATVDDTIALVAGVGNSSLEVVDLLELGFAAEVSTDLTGGRSAMLDMLGAERGMGRGDSETDASYADRVRYLPDTIAPNALYRAASRILTPLGIPWRLLESRHPDDFEGAAWGYFAFDDPVLYNWVLGRDHFFWSGNGFEYRGFYLVVERMWYGDFGAPFDHPPVPGGVHPSDAFDWMFYDGYPLGWYDDMDRAVAEIEKTRAAGVPWLVVIVDNIP